MLSWAEGYRGGQRAAHVATFLTPKVPRFVVTAAPETPTFGGAPGGGNLLGTASPTGGRRDGVPQRLFLPVRDDDGGNKDDDEPASMMSLLLNPARPYFLVYARVGRTWSAPGAEQP